MCCCRWYLFRYTVSKVIIMTPILPVYYAELMSIHCHPIKPHALLRYVHVFSTYSYKFHLMLCTTHNNTSVTNVSSPTTCLVANQKQLQYWHFGAVRNCRIEQSSSRDWNFMPWVQVKPRPISWRQATASSSSSSEERLQLQQQQQQLMEQQQHTHCLNEDLP